MNIRALFFPYMHPEFVSRILPQGVYFLDPGIASMKGYTGPFVSPDNLRLTPEQALKYVNKILNFGDQFKDPKELSYLLKENSRDFYGETSMEIKTELERVDKISNVREADRENDQILQAQLALLLAWSMEERLKEYQEIQQGVNERWKDFLSDLGIEGEEFYFPGLSSSPEAENSNIERELDWSKILPWFLRFLGDWSLFVQDPQIKHNWEENGLVFEDFSANQGLGHCYAFGYELALTSKAFSEYPWMKNRYHIIYLA